MPSCYKARSAPKKLPPRNAKAAELSGFAYNLARLDGLLDRANLLEAPPRRLGVYLDGTRVTDVREGKAREGGWLAGDVVLEVDGVEVATREQLVDRLRAGDARKTFVLRRGEERVESVLDWSEPSVGAGPP